MKKYEIMVIIDNALSEKDAQGHIKTSITDRIGVFGGKITFEDFWGSRGFAYKINGQTWGFYYLAQFEIDGEKLLELRNELNIDTKVVRFLMSSVDPKSAEPKKYADIKKENDALEKEQTKEKAPVVVAEKAPKPQKPAPEKAEPKDKVDQKIDQVVDNIEL